MALAGQLAAAIDLLLQAPTKRTRLRTPPRSRPPWANCAGALLRRTNASVFANDAYLIRAWPAPFLQLLREHAASGRSEFSNRGCAWTRPWSAGGGRQPEARLLLLQRRLQKARPASGEKPAVAACACAWMHRCD